MFSSRSIKTVIAVAISLFSPVLWAHAGHDHNHWTSTFLHVLFYASLFAAACACGFAVYKAVKRNQHIQGE